MAKDCQSLVARFYDKEVIPSLGWSIPRPTGCVPYKLQAATASCLEASPSLPRLIAQAPSWQGPPGGAASLRDSGGRGV